MKFFKRIFFFVITNILVLLTISITLSLLGVQNYLTRSGIDYQALAIFCLVAGFAGSLISLALSRVMAKLMMGVQVIPQGAGGREGWLLHKVAELASRAGLPKTPEVGIFEAAELNAFATGPTQSRALVAVSTGLLNHMNDREIEAVVGHEIAHIKNGDMVTMVLLQGIINTFVMFIARIIAFAISNSSRDENRNSGGTNMMVVWLLEIVLSILGMIVVAWYSRKREFAADAGSAALVGKDAMASALEKLGRAYGLIDPTPNSFSTYKISGKEGGFMSLLASHPPIAERIARLRSVRTEGYSSRAA